MMTQKIDIRLLKLIYTDAQFESLFLALDNLHDAASEGRVHEITALSKDELIGWLEEIAYTARETVRELQADRLVDCSPAVKLNGDLL